MSSHVPLQGVIFDCDGVLVDTEPLHYEAFQLVLRPLGLGFDYDHYLDRYIGFDDRDAFLEAFREGGRLLTPEILAALMAKKAEALLGITSRGISSFPGVVELVRELARRELPMAIASGALRHEVESFVAALGLSEVFQTIVAADDVTRSKPDPETYLKALGKLAAGAGLNHVNPRAIIAIEDTPAGIQSARAAGLYVIGVPHSYPADELQGLADHVVQSMSALNLARLVELVKVAVADG